MQYNKINNNEEEMKKIVVLLGIVIAANIFIAIYFRQPMAFVIAALAGIVAIYLYLAEDEPKQNK